MIDRFSGEYRFLSNFWLCFVRLDNQIYPSVEHAYQAAKTIDPYQRQWFNGRKITSSQAKKEGAFVTIRDDWDSVKLGIMLDLLRQKFKADLLKSRLVATDPQELIEGNLWGDRFWGVCRGVGENHLGKLLMQVREELK